MNDITEGGKYYVPDADDFLPWMEFQRLIGSGSGYKWNNSLFTDSTTLIFIHGEIQGGHIRVKHLDNDDIVECGFGDGVQVAGITLYNKGTVLLHFTPETLRVVISRPVEDTEITERFALYNMFDGVVRNKSELKRVIKQIKV